MALSFANFNYGKYKGILVSVALFLLLDASVLILNFFISFQIADDAVGVNLAGRQRMLSQRMAKSLYSLETEYRNEGFFNADTLEELKLSSGLFDRTLYAFIDGGIVKGAAGSDVALDKVKDVKALQALSAAEKRWVDYKKSIDLFVSSTPNNTSIEQVLSTTLHFARDQNLPLLKLMNDFTVALENVATSKADRLRIIQTIGISLAIMNFLFILFHFVRQLRDSDIVLEEARNETVEILNTVNEGLCLIDRDLIIGSQYSQELEGILMRSNIAGESFKSLLENIISSKDTKTTTEFISLLFNPKVKEKLIGDLNPLDEVNVAIMDSEGVSHSRYLSFSFSRAMVKGDISHVLVAVRDISEKILLAQQLEAVKSDTNKQIEMLTGVLHASPMSLQKFINNAFQTYKKINDILKEPGKSGSLIRHKLDNIFIEVHKFKGDSSVLKLDNFSERAHSFEDKINTLRSKEDLTGNDFLSLTINLEELIEYTEQVRELVSKMASFAESKADIQVSSHLDLQPLHEFVVDTAGKYGKEAYLVCSGLTELPVAAEWVDDLRPILIQLLRNSLVHGIEMPDIRNTKGKAKRGRIDIQAMSLPDNEIEIIVQDNGAGFDYGALRKSALDSGQWQPKDIENWSHNQLISTIFHSDISTAAELSEDAGRGIGMSAVLSWVNAQQGSLKISSREGKYTRFTISLKVPKAGPLAA